MCLAFLTAHKIEMQLAYSGNRTSIVHNIKIISGYGVSHNAHSS
jgi:hypothetical protein